MAEKSSRKNTVRYAVVGIGHIAQVAVLPAFANAENSELVAIVSDDPEKRREIGEQYGLERTYAYEDYDDMLARGDVDAVYIALPNSMHCDFTVRAAKAKVHVLCEKPLAVTEEECEQMIDACESNKVKLMTAYRLHFEKGNLKAIDIVKSGQLGEPKLFNSVFTMPVKPGDIRVQAELGGGTLYDIGIYCINAARNLFRAEPIEVSARSVCCSDERSKEVDEATVATLRFSDNRVASFTCSFAASKVSQYQVVGTEGNLRLDPAYGYTKPIKHYLTVGEKTSSRTFAKRDQFAPELIYFSRCILRNRVPEPSGVEGLADVRVIRALYRSAETGRPIELEPFRRSRRPSLEQEITRPPVKEPELVNAESPSGS